MAALAHGRGVSARRSRQGEATQDRSRTVTRDCPRRGAAWTGLTQASEAVSLSASSPQPRAEGPRLAVGGEEELDVVDEAEVALELAVDVVAFVLDHLRALERRQNAAQVLLGLRRQRSASL